MFCKIFNTRVRYQRYHLTIQRSHKSGVSRRSVPKWVAKFKFLIFILNIQQVNLRYPSGKVAVACMELQYHSNLHKNNSTWHWNSLTYEGIANASSNDPSFVAVGLQLFKRDPKNKKKINLELQYHHNSHKNYSSWPLTSLTYEGTPYCICDPSLVVVRLSKTDCVHDFYQNDDHQVNSVTWFYFTRIQIIWHSYRTKWSSWS